MNLINKLLKTLTVVLIAGTAVIAQRPEPTLFDQFGDDISCEQVRGRLDTFMSDIARGTEWQGVIVAYEGKFTRYRGDQPYKVLPMFGENQVIMKTFRDHFIFRGFDSKRIIFLSGGYRDDYEIEFWLVPQGGRLPNVTPTRDSIKYRKGTPQPISDCP